MTGIEFSVLGRPAPQGSKKFVGMRGGRPILVEQSIYVKPWRDSVEAAARMAMRIGEGSWPLAGPLRVGLDIYLHHAPSNRDSQPTGHGTGDLDKHARSIFDALVTAGAVTDDALIVSLTGRKWWATPTRPPGAHIRITPLEEKEAT